MAMDCVILLYAFFLNRRIQLLDKFYTKPEVAKQCYERLVKKFTVQDRMFLEPSAGSGAFLPYLNNYKAYDIQPEGQNIIKQDFFTFTTNKSDYITIGNPPFGKRSKMAIDFFNHAAKFSSVIAFIVPVSFMKWSVQKQLSDNFELVDVMYLDYNSFLDKGKNYGIRTVFQIWVNKKSEFASIYVDLRMKKSPPIAHPDFLIWQHNATPESRKHVEENWEIATWRQGYKDYNELFYKEKDYEKVKNMVENTNLQFFFIKPLTDQARIIILGMDFNALAERNTSTPGFGKGDFVSYYLELLND